MDPNDPNNQGGQTPPETSDPRPEDLTPEALYGPSTPGVDPMAADPNAVAVPEGDFTQDALPPIDETGYGAEAQPQDMAQDPNAEYAAPYQDPTLEQQPAGTDLPPQDPNAGGSLPPIPSRSKFPIIIIGVAVVLLLVVGGVLFMLTRGSGSTRPRQTARPVPSATEEPISCADDPTAPGCENTTPTVPPATTAPSGSAHPGGSLSPQQCQLIYGGPCP